MRPIHRHLVFLAALLTLTTPLGFPSMAAAKQGRPAAPKHRPERLARLSSNVAVGNASKRRSRAKERVAKPASAKSSSSDLLFKGTKIKDFQNQSAPGAVSEVADPAGSGEPTLEMTVANSDVYPITPTSDPRAQLDSPSIFNPGDEFWWSSEFYLPTDFPASVPGWLAVMEGPYGAPYDGTPPWHIEVNGEYIRWGRNDTYNWDIPWQMPLVRGSWVHVLLHERFAGNGFVEMWIDGQQITFFGSGTYNPNHVAPTTRLEMQTMDHSNDGGPNFAVIQSYREAGMFSSVSLFQGPMTLGTTRASVEG